MSTVSEHVGIFSPNRRRGVNTEIFADATDAVVDSSITIRGTEEGSSAEAKIDFVQDSNLKEIPEITLKSDVKREYEGVETLQDKAIIAAGYEKTEYYTDDADNTYTKTTYEHDQEGIRQETEECEVTGGSKEVTSRKGFNISQSGVVCYDGEDEWGFEKSLNVVTLIGPFQCETPDGTDPLQIVNVGYLGDAYVKKAGEVMQTMEGGLQANAKQASVSSINSVGFKTVSPTTFGANTFSKLAFDEQHPYLMLDESSDFNGLELKSSLPGDDTVYYTPKLNVIVGTAYAEEGAEWPAGIVANLDETSDGTTSMGKKIALSGDSSLPTLTLESHANTVETDLGEQTAELKTETASVSLTPAGLSFEKEADNAPLEGGYFNLSVQDDDVYVDCDNIKIDAWGDGFFVNNAIKIMPDGDDTNSAVLSADSNNNLNLAAGTGGIVKTATPAQDEADGDAVATIDWVKTYIASLNS